MGFFLAYIFKAAISLALFYLFYRLLLVKDTFHRFNRLALLLSLVLSSVLPLCHFSLPDTATVQQTLQVVVEEPINVSFTDEVNHEPIWKVLLLLTYIIGLLISFVAFLFSMGRMLYLIRKGERKSLEDGSILVLHDENVAPFSWMRYIVLSRKDAEEGCSSILVHERAHIHFFHSWDMLLVQIALILQWFNPAAWLMKRELQAVHEFEADDEVLRQGIDAKSYQLLLIKKAVGTRLYSMSNSLNHSSLKKRITMMLKKKSNPWARLKYAYVLPLAAITVTAFASPEVSTTLDEFSTLKVSDLTMLMQEDNVKSTETQFEINQKDDEIVKGVIVDAGTGKPLPGATVLIMGTTRGTVSDMKGKFSIQLPSSSKKVVLQISFIGYKIACIPQNDFKSPLKVSLVKDVIEITKIKSASVKRKIKESDETFIIVEQMPEFPGGTNAMFKFLAKNIKYPVKAQKTRIQGRVIVQFVVNKLGRITNPKVVRSVDADLDAEALRVINMMPNWKPGKQRGKTVNVQYTVPITFKLQGEKKKTSTVKMSMMPDKTLVFIDGERVDMKVLKALGPDRIEKITILKDDKAVAKYGAEGKNGVMLVTLKKGGKTAVLPDNMLIKKKEAKKLTNVALDKVLLIIDGVRAPKGAVGRVNPNIIEKVKVLKGKSATDLYGADGKNGVVLITLKKGTVAAQGKKIEMKGDLKNVLFIVDGVRSSKKEVSKIKPDAIEKMQVLKGKSATTLYGADAKNGAVLITLKKKSSGEVFIVGS